MTPLARVLVLLLLPYIAGACTWDRTWPLQTVPYTGKVPERDTQLALIRLHSAVIGKPVRETVWENGVGARWDPKASTRIGFAQSYLHPVEQLGAGPILPTGAAGTASGAPAPGRTISRISVPFGRLLLAALESATASVSARSAVCDALECDARISSLSPDAPVADLELKFAVWEQPLNHINFAARLDVTCVRGPADPTRSVIVHSQLTRPLSPGGLSWHRDAVQRMSDEASRFAHDVTERVLGACAG